MMGQLTCPHDYEVIEEVKATCTKTGQEVYECTLCGKTKKEKLDKTSHNLREKNVIEPTCTTEGYTLMVCKDCNYEEKTNIISSLSHDYLSNIVPPTCIEEGYTFRECILCGYTVKEDYIEPTSHNFSSWETVLEPTDLSEGIKSRKCYICNYEEKDFISAKIYVDLTYIKAEFDSSEVYQCDDFNELSFRFNCAVANLSEKLICNVYEISDFSTLLNELVDNCNLPYALNVNASLKGNELTITFDYIDDPIYKTNKVLYTQMASLNYTPTKSSRGKDFDDFKINQSMYKFKVTNTDSLHYALERGALPIVEKGSITEKVYNEIKAVLREIIDDDMTDTEKVTAIYEWLVMNVTYDGELLDLLYKNVDELNRYNGFYLEGVFLDRVAVCEGISKAFTAMCNIEGIKCVSVEGYSVENPNGAGHAWNKVYIDGDWYIVDATSGGTIVSNKYELLTYKFLLTSEEIFNNYYIGETFTNLKCNKVIDNYKDKTFEYNYLTRDFVINSQEELNEIVGYLYSVQTKEVSIEFKPTFNYGDSLTDEITKAFKENMIYATYTYIEYEDSFMLIRKA